MSTKKLKQQESTMNAMQFRTALKYLCMYVRLFAWCDGVGDIYHLFFVITGEVSDTHF